MMVTHAGCQAMVRVTVIEFWLYFNHVLDMYTLLYLFIFVCAWVFVAAYGISRVADSRSYSLVAVCKLLIAVAPLIVEQSL